MFFFLRGKTKFLVKTSKYLEIIHKLQDGVCGLCKLFGLQIQYFLPCIRNLRTFFIPIIFTMMYFHVLLITKNNDIIK